MSMESNKVVTLTDSMTTNLNFLPASYQKIAHHTMQHKKELNKLYNPEFANRGGNIDNDFDGIKNFVAEADKNMLSN